MYKKKLEKIGAKAFKKLKNNKVPDLIEIEKKLNMEFSNTHKRILSDYKSSIIFTNDIRYKPNIQTPMTTSDGYQSLYILYGIIDESKSLLKKNKQYKNILPKFLITIGETLSEDQICLDIKNGRILYWYHEAFSEDNQVFEIANSFEEFILKLEEDNEDIDIEDYIIDSESYIDF